MGEGDGALELCARPHGGAGRAEEAACFDELGSGSGGRLKKNQLLRFISLQTGFLKQKEEEREKAHYFALPGRDIHTVWFTMAVRVSRDSSRDCDGGCVVDMIEERVLID